MVKDVVVKHNKLVEANYKLSLQEQKLVLVLSSYISKGDSEFKKCIFSVSELVDALGLSKNFYYSELKDITKSLISRVIQIKEPDGLLQVGWLSSAKYFDDLGKVELSFSDKLKPYLLQLKEHFTKLELKQLVTLSSVYAIRIYELCKQYEKLKERTIDLEDLKIILGIEKKEYKLYGHFKDKVLKIAEREINEKTDLKITIEALKTGRKITSIKFIIEKNIDTGFTHEIQDIGYHLTKQNDNVSKLLSYCKTQNSEIEFFISESIEKYDLETFENNIKYTNKYAKDNYLAYLKKALKQNYASTIKNSPKPAQKKIPVIEEKEQIDLANLTASEKEHLAKVQKSIFNK